ncbi:MAG: RND family transporter [Planctomycetes bacterium]|nr:RND family transporter [Planctomycetota bacterium]
MRGLKYVWPGLAILVACLSVGLAVPLRDEFDRLDASTASMTLEGDQENQRYNRVSLLFTSDEFVLIGLTREDLFTPPGVAAVESLRAACEQVEGVASALSLTNVALLRSHEKQTSLFQALIQQKRLGDAGISFEKAREELTQHELYAGNLVSKDAKTAGIVVTLARTPEQVDVTNRWLDLNETRLEAERADSARSTAETAAQLAQAQAAVERMLPEWTAMEDARKASRRQVIEEVRGLVEERAAAGADVGLSGVPALAVEMVEAIGRDLRTFGSLSLGFVCLFLLLVFRRVRWVLLPLLATGGTVVGTLWLMRLTGKRITVITGNLPSLLLVIGLAHSIHLIVRYRELLVVASELRPYARVRRLVRDLFWPCAFTAATTGVGFSSLYFAGSRPIIDFGFLMSFGVLLALVLSFVVLPGFLVILPHDDRGRLELSARFLSGLGRASLAHPAVVLALTAAAFAVGGWGISKIEVEARFVDYFQPSSPIHQGLAFLDDRLGGTTGLEVVLTGDEGGAFGALNPANLDAAAEVAEWLDAQPEVGTVMSYVGILDELRKAAPMMNRAFASTQVVSQLRDSLPPYVVIEEREVAGRSYAPLQAVRITARVRETDAQLKRLEFRQRVRDFLAGKFPAEGPIEAEATGMFVLYANMLDSLKQSQLTTTVTALLAILAMLTLLFRSLSAAVLALIPNLLPIVVVLGCLGLFGIPLDMATVMIASVSLGIGVDCAIHYLFRFREEVAVDGHVDAALLRSHGSIGTSILYTSLTGVVGFTVLVFSEFRPNAYFGVFTGVAMAAALFGVLTLLPVLLRAYNPFRAAAREGVARVADARAEQVAEPERATESSPGAPAEGEDPPPRGATSAT